jgi:hypothetical protein
VVFPDMEPVLGLQTLYSNSRSHDL